MVPDVTPREFGLVIAVNRNTLEVMRSDGRIECCRLHGRFRSAAHRGEGVVAGDRVLLGPVPSVPAPGALAPLRTVVAVEPRSSVLRRHLTSRVEDRGREDLTVAANVDLGLVVQAYRDPPFRPAVADRLVALVRACAIPCVLVLNKSEGVSGDALEAILAPYRGLSVEGFAVSALAGTGAGLEPLAARCAGHLVVMLGPSGVGKSSLVRGLCPSATPATGDVSHARLRRGRGRHTTVQSRIYPLPDGGYLMDTAGIRSLALPDGTEPLDAFPEIASWAPGCRFADCTHLHEPGCAVRAALAAGSLPRAAYDGYRRVLRDQAARPSRR